jgi:hypothetical protein
MRADGRAKEPLACSNTLGASDVLRPYTMPRGPMPRPVLCGETTKPRKTTSAQFWVLLP